MRDSVKEVVEYLKEAREASKAAFLLPADIDDMIEVAKLIQRQDQNKGRK